jgi:hypothetical protein
MKSVNYNACGYKWISNAEEKYNIDERGQDKGYLALFEYLNDMNYWLEIPMNFASYIHSVTNQV